MKSFYIAAPNKLVLGQKIKTYDTLQLPGMNLGGWGDPHLYVRQPQTLNPNDLSSGKFLAKWGDNKSAGLNELLLLHIETIKHKIKIYYTNKNYSTGKVVNSIRVVKNGVSTIYTNSAFVTAGPVTLSIAKIGNGTNSYMNFEMKWSTINDALFIGGAATVIFKKISTAGNTTYNGLDGATWDGFTYAGQSYGLSRSSFETVNIQSQTQFSAQTDISLSDEDLTAINSLNVSESSIVDGLNDDATSDPVHVWDPSVNGDAGAGIVSSLEIFQNYGTVDHYLANLVNNGNTIDGMDINTAGSIIDNFITNETGGSYGYVQAMNTNTRINSNIIP